MVYVSHWFWHLDYAISMVCPSSLIELNTSKRFGEAISLVNVSFVFSFLRHFALIVVLVFSKEIIVAILLVP